LNKWMTTPDPRSLLVVCEDQECEQRIQSISPLRCKWVCGLSILTLMIALFAAQPVLASPQSISASSDSSVDSTSTTATAVKFDLRYERPTQRTIASNYLFDSFGPYPIATSTVAAGINQFGNSPPEWSQGFKGYSRRLGSNFGIGVVATTTRYAMAEALHEDTMYYRCECVGVFPRLRHAVLSTLTARDGIDGHRVFSFPALVAPYAGTMTAVYAWYPNRFGAKDAFRLGNYSMLAYVGSNISLEFLYNGPHSLISRMHLNNAHGSPEQGPNK